MHFNNMRKIVFILCLSFLSACYDSELDTGSLIETNNATTDNTIGNPINLKLTYDIVGEIDNESNYLKLPTGCSRLDECLNKIGATGIERIFPNAGKYERYQKEYGLNQWYSFVINKDALSSRAIYEVFGDIAIFIEPIRKMYLNDYKVQEFESDVSRSVYQYPFNDPLWRFQWNMKNDGLLGESGKDTKRDFADGADINIVPAWRETTGDSRVVVSIVDGGIDIIHEDLKENLWINNGEIPGNGIDDDNNGYIDDVHGYNFVDRNGEIIPHEHGTHVAGVIAAVNNNGKGISGIAGGNGFKDSGAKIMSCQIFKPNPDYDPSDPHSSPNISVQDDKTIAEAIVYGANNGALISQNSWGYNDFLPEPKVITEAIDYFNNIAGMYEGSLMKGGICIFSAGNDGVDKKAYPAARSQVVAVSSFAPDYAATWYTNYGYWVDLCAPGGSSPFDGKYSYIDGKPIAEILSTLPSKNGKGLYGYMQGTSMACPHVSGIAALIISKYGKDGFTNEELRNRLLSGIKAIDINKYNSVNYKDKLGVGFVDATVALKDYDENSIPPLPVFIQSKSEVGYDFIKIFWTSDESGDDLFKYRLYYSSQIISSDNYLTEGVESFDISANCAPDGQEFTRTLEKLKTGTKYYFALQSIARNGKTSS